MAELREARAQVRRTNKPLLTQTSLNSLLVRVRGDAKLAEKARSNLLGFLTDHFTLTDRQKHLMQQLMGDRASAVTSRRELQKAISDAQLNKRALFVSIPSTTTAGCPTAAELQFRAVTSKDGVVRLEAVPVVSK